MFDKAREYRNSMIRQIINSESISLFPGGPKEEILIGHSDRVEKILMKLIDSEMKDCGIGYKAEMRLAAIFHDIGKIKTEENHAIESAYIAKEWLENNLELEESSIMNIVHVIQEHSNKSNRSTLEVDILKDADLLDETGAMGIIMNIINIKRSDTNYYKSLLDKLKSKEIVYSEESMNMLVTSTAQLMMKEKIQFIKSFISQLENEI